MVLETEMTDAEVDRHNMSTIHVDDRQSCYICIRCRRKVSYEDSYSSGKRKLHCRLCINQLAEESNNTISEYLMKNIWS